MGLIANNPGIVALICGILAVACFGGWFYFLRRTRAIEDLPTSRIRSAAQGYAELEGQGRPLSGDPVVSPLTGTRCIWWKYRIHERSDSGLRRNEWRLVDSGVSDDIFLLVDETGECIVDPTGATIIPGATRRWSGSRRNAPMPVKPHRSSWLDSGLQIFNASLGTIGRSTAYRFEEQMLMPLDPLYAIGFFRSQSFAQDGQGAKQEVRSLLAEWKRDAQKMAEFDANNDGEIDMDEWERAREAAIAEVRSAQLERSTHPSLHILAKPRDRRKFLLSSIPQAELIRRDRRYAVGFFIAFLVNVGATAWAIASL